MEIKEFVFKLKLLFFCVGLSCNFVLAQNKKNIFTEYNRVPNISKEYCEYNKYVDIYPYSQLESIDVSNVKINDLFWNHRIATVQETTLPLLFDIAEKQGKLDNFRIVSGRKRGKIRLYNAPDSDVYKLLEAAGYSFIYRDNLSLRLRCDSIISDIVAAQDSTGYLHTQYMLDFIHESSPKPDNKNVRTFGYGPSNRWRSFKTNWPFAYSQLYCAGHMMEAGIAYYKGTGDSKLLDASIRFADLICSVFDKKKISMYADHPEVEIGLMKLYEFTGNKKYLNTADLMCRYINFSRPVDIHNDENSKPLVEQSCAYGHCVRTAYLYAGATDVVRATGSYDLLNAVGQLWRSIVEGKMYIHGGTGNGTKAEQHGEKYDLPISATYSECCASIAQAQWNHSLNLLKGDACYSSLVELEMYNSALSGISLDGKRFFYSNKINIGLENRKNKHSGIRETYLFCCPSKLPVFICGIGRWIYAKDRDGIYINQFIGSSLTTEIGDKKVSLRQESDYIYNGKSRIVIGSDGFYSINIRVPQWLKDRLIPCSPYYYDKKRKSSSYCSIKLNGLEYSVSENSKGYLSIKRNWSRGDTIDINFDMDVRRIYTETKIRSNGGRVALMRGPLLYCFEGVDNDFDVRKMVLPSDSEITSYTGIISSEKTVFLKGKCLYEGSTAYFKSVPYFMWENRGVSSMVLLPVENPVLIDFEKEYNVTDFNTNG